MTAATDKNESRAHMDLNAGTIDALVAAKNGMAQFHVNWPGQTPEKHKCFWFVGQTVPDNTDYPDTIAPIGSLYTLLSVTTGAIAGAKLYMKTAAATWTVIGSVT